MTALGFDGKTDSTGQPADPIEDQGSELDALLREEALAVLGLGPTASREDVKRMYRRLVLQSHPDRNGGRSQDAFEQIVNAYLLLERGELLVDGYVRPPQRPFDVKVSEPKIIETVTLSLQLVANGGELAVVKELPVTCARCLGRARVRLARRIPCVICRGLGEIERGARYEQCARCNGLGEIAEKPCADCVQGIVKRDVPLRVEIPPGIDSGAILPAEPPAGARALLEQPLAVRVRVERSKLFTRMKDPHNLLLSVPVTVSEAALGATVRIPTLARPIMLRIPPGAQPGMLLRVAGHGLPRRGRDANGCGDLYARVDVIVPRALNDEQRQAIKTLARCDRDPRAEAWRDLLASESDREHSR